MSIRLKDDSEFLHIPKTGGEWVTKVLQQNDLIEEMSYHKHLDYDLNLFRSRLPTGKKWIIHETRNAPARFRSLLSLKRKTKQPFRFCFVRHPLSWYESWWKYMNGRGWNTWGATNSTSDWHPCSILNELGSDDFNTFVRNVIEARPGYVSELYFSFTKPGISFIGKTENLARDLTDVLSRLGFAINSESVSKIEAVNVSKSPSSAVVWDEELRRAVLMLELPALVHFGYIQQTELAEMGISTPLKPNEALQSDR